MNDLTDILTSETVLTALGVFVGVVWSVVKGSELYSRRTNAVTRFIIRIIEGAVAYTYTNAVREWKAQNGGKLQPEQKGVAVALAKAKAEEVAEIYGLEDNPLIAEPAIIEAEIEKAVTRLKNRGKGGAVRVNE
jgi:hypothetical protein